MTLNLETGIAYAVFNCNAPKNLIEEELPEIRESVQTPNELELSLMNWPKWFICLRQQDIRDIVKQCKKDKVSFNYLLEAKYPRKTNIETADELRAILNQAYQSPLYKEGEKYIGEIVYKAEDGIFEFLE